MEVQKASRSAGIIAAHRSIESSKPESERICYDPFAAHLLPPKFTVVGETEYSEETALQLFNELLPGFHEHFLARTRYIDDYLQSFIKNGMEQLLILGAGYDSRAYRFAELRTKTKVFEVDHPVTQEVKKEKLRDIFQTLPDHVTFVPIDFQKEKLATGLLGKGYDKSLKTLVIWEGVTMYIDLTAVDETLLFILNNTGKGSSLIFDHTYTDVINGTSERKEAKEWLRIASASDEPLRFGFGMDQVEQFLTERGFCNVACITNQYFKDHYFTGVHSDRESTPIMSLVQAEV